MATDKQNWTKSYNRANPNATAAARAAAFRSWQNKRNGTGGTTNTNTPLGLPDGWGMEKGPDIVGSWKAKPNLNSDEFDVQQGTDKKWYGRRITELTGLDPWMRQAVSKWDTDQANRSNLLSGIESQAVNASRTIADAGAARMKDLAALVNAPAQQSQALGAVAGGPQQMASGDQQAGGIAAGSAAKLAISQMADNANTVAASAPTIAANSIATLANKERSDSAVTRQKLISAFQTTVAEAKAAKSKALAQTYTDQARLLAAAIQSGAKITAEQLNQMGQNARTTQTNETALSMNNDDNTTSSQNNQNTTNSQARADRVKRRDDFVGGIKLRLDGEYTSGIDANGKATSSIKGGTEMPMAVINDAIAQKIPLGPVLAAVAGSARGKAIRKPKAAQQILAKMVAAGIPRNTAIAVIARQLGVDLRPGGGVVAGPPSPVR
jgi:hypothetical protein